MTFSFTLAITSCVFGQNKFGYFKYGVISYEIIDSLDINEANIAEVISLLGDQFNAEVFFNKSWFIVVKSKHDGLSKSMYNLKSKILYEFYDGSNCKTLSIDSIFALYKQDPKLATAKDTLQELMGIVKSPNDVKSINGFECRKEYFIQDFGDRTVDEIWVTTFLKVPNLVFRDQLYFLNEGIPVEIVQDFVDLKIKWGILESLPISRKDKIFIMDQSGYSIKTVDTKNLIYEGIHFIRTYEPKQGNE